MEVLQGHRSVNRQWRCSAAGGVRGLVMMDKLVIWLYEDKAGEGSDVLVRDN